jgi:hypothetical protein
MRNITVFAKMQVTTPVPSVHKTVPSRLAAYNKWTNKS